VTKKKKKKNRLCRACETSIDKLHLNARYCLNCRKDNRRVPYLSPAQIRKAVKLAGTMYFDDVAKEVGVSRATLRRYARTKQDVNWNGHKYDHETINKVAEYYLTHSLAETQKKYPHVRVRSIVERYTQNLKCKQWYKNEMSKLLRMVGLLPRSVIAKHIGRPPNVSVKKKLRLMGFQETGINTLNYALAKHFVKPNCPFFSIRVGETGASRWYCLWVDAYKYLKPGLAPWITSAIQSLAKFQIWMHGSRKNIITLMGGGKLERVN